MGSQPAAPAANGYQHEFRKPRNGKEEDGENGWVPRLHLRPESRSLPSSAGRGAFGHKITLTLQSLAAALTLRPSVESEDFVRSPCSSVADCLTFHSLYPSAAAPAE